jgi:subtilisin family serine protease
MSTSHPTSIARRSPRAALGVAVLLGALVQPAQAQLRLPSLNTPSLPALPRTPATPLQEALQQAVPLQDLRRSTVRDLLRRHADTVEADPAGEPMRRQELLLIAPAPATVDAALAQGFTVLREQTLAELGLRHVVLRPPAGMGTAQAAERLRAIDPQLELDFNHLYTRSGDVQAADAAPSAIARARRARVGLIDSGVERRHAALRHANVSAWGCGGAEHPSAHGTAVASLLIGRDGGFSGVLADAALYAADVFCERTAGGAGVDPAAGGSVEVIVQALAWMARERVPVVNISLVGPSNRLLEQAVRALVRKGHLVVAAVGNDGPAAPPLYPASYPGVVGVTGITTARRVLPEAAQGPHVMLAAPGAELAVARPGGGYVVARGTSFAAPVVAGLLAEGLHEPDPEQADAALTRLGARAVDLGPPGRDPVFGLGCVGEAARTPPERVQARAR